MPPFPRATTHPGRGSAGWGTLRASIALIGDKGPAGRLLRVILPVAVLTVGLSGPAIYAAHRLGYVGIAEGTALFGAINAVLVFWAALRCASSLNAEHLALTRLRGEMQSHALHDPATGLANRGFFMDQLARRAALADRRTSTPFAVCTLELDGIGEVSRLLGEGVGGRILVKAADVIRDCVRASDMVARLGDDKFGILLEEIADAKDIDRLAERIVSSVPLARSRIWRIPRRAADHRLDRRGHEGLGPEPAGRDAARGRRRAPAGETARARPLRAHGFRGPRRASASGCPWHRGHSNSPGNWAPPAPDWLTRNASSPTFSAI